MNTSNLLNQYSDIYYRMLLEDINGINILPFNVKQFKKALLNFKVLNSNEITEDKNSYIYYIQDEMIYYIKQHLNQQIDQQKLCNCIENKKITDIILNKTFVKPFYLIEVDQNNILDVKKTMKQYFKEIYEDDLDFISNFLIDNIQDTDRTDLLYLKNVMFIF